MLSPEDEELREEFGDLVAYAVLVDAAAEVGFGGADGGGEIEGFEGA